MEDRIERNDAGGPRVIGVVEEDDLHARGAGGKDTKICSFGSYGRTEGIGVGSMYLLSGRIMKLDGPLMWIHVPLRSKAGFYPANPLRSCWSGCRPITKRPDESK
jgi:hypothetical protein